MRKQNTKLCNIYVLEFKKFITINQILDVSLLKNWKKSFLGFFV